MLNSAPFQLSKEMHALQVSGYANGYMRLEDMYSRLGTESSRWSASNVNVMWGLYTFASDECQIHFQHDNETTAITNKYSRYATLLNEYHHFAARGGYAVEATWMYYLFDASTAKGWVDGKTESAADAVDIDSEVSCLQSHDHGAYGHEDPLPAPRLEMVVRGMVLLWEQAMHSAADLEQESNPGTSPM